MLYNMYYTIYVLCNIVCNTVYDMYHVIHCDDASKWYIAGYIICCVK